MAQKPSLKLGFVMTSLERLIGINGARLAKAVQVGSLFHDVSQIEEALRRYCMHIFANNDDNEYPHSFSGSGTAVRIGRRHFLFCCGHQLTHFRPDQIALHPHQSDVTLTASHMLQPIQTPENADTDYIDARAFEYDVENYPFPNLSSEFFPASDDRIWPHCAVGTFLLCGFPTHRQSISYDPPNVTARMLATTAKFDGATNSPYLLRLKLNSKLSSDGMSGGPVFYIGGQRDRFFVGWAGMIMRGGAASEYLHFLAADYLIEMALHLPIDEMIVSPGEARM
jgi:hypothetical protein